MADITFKGFVDRVFPSFILVTENHSKKEGDNWVNTGKTTYQVWTNYVEMGFEAEEGQLVEVSGRFKTEPSQDGKYKNNIVSPSAISLITKQSKSAKEPSLSYLKGTPLEDAPF